MVRAATAFLREIQSHKYVLDGINFDDIETPQKALDKALARMGDGG
jgi:hypothetical protein